MCSKPGHSVSVCTQQECTNKSCDSIHDITNMIKCSELHSGVCDLSPQEEEHVHHHPPYHAVPIFCTLVGIDVEATSDCDEDSDQPCLMMSVVRGDVVTSHKHDNILIDYTRMMEVTTTSKRRA